jgi:ABC-2 type transport system permease protein
MALLRASLATGLQYRADFLLDAGTGLLRAAATVAPLALVQAHTGSLGGFSIPEAGVVLGLFLLMSGLVGGFVEPNLGEVVEAVRSGTFDLVLLKPADAQLLASLRTVSPSSLWDVVAAVAVLAWSMPSLPPPSVGEVGVAGLLVGCGLASLYGLWLLVISLSFVFVRVDNLRYLLGAVTDAGRFPTTVFRGWSRWVLTYAIPVGLLTTFPVLALRGEAGPGVVASALATATVFVVGSRVAWTAALARYTSASS